MKMWSNSFRSWSWHVTHVLPTSVHLFQFFHGKAEVGRGGVWRYDKRANNRGSVVVVNVGDPSLPNDLVSRLAAMLSQYEDHGSTHDVIFEPSQVLSFHLKAPQDSSARSLDPFVFPQFLYLDQFLAKNFEIANEKRRLNMEIQEEISALTRQKEFITHFNVCVHSFSHLRFVVQRHFFRIRIH
jgi:hypothetical protein